MVTNGNVYLYKGMKRIGNGTCVDNYRMIYFYCLKFSKDKRLFKQK